MGIFETITIIIAIEDSHWSEFKTGIVFSIFGMIGVLFLAKFSFFIQHFKDYQILLVATILMLISCLLLNNEYFLFSFQHHESLLFLSLFCTVSVGYPIVHATLLGLFSRSLRSREGQGEALGLFTASGNIARILFPFLSGVILDSYHHYNIIFFIMALTLLAVIFVYFRIRPVFEKLLD